jgi:hypothetical protein
MKYCLWENRSRRRWKRRMSPLITFGEHHNERSFGHDSNVVR